MDSKERIRIKYKGLADEKISIIPAISKLDLYDENTPKRIAIYARVSTDNIEQTTSFELQKNYYEDLVKNKPNWTLVSIYADEGLTGTDTLHRTEFNRMIQDAKDGKFDMIITKMVSRFARNTVITLSTVRELKSLPNPVEVFFETEGINSFDPDCELVLTIMSMMAQEESHNKSESMNASIEMRFRKGIFLTPPLLGYDQDNDGNLVINPDEAKTVKLIFFLFLSGHSVGEITSILEELKRPTKKGQLKWSYSSVIGILQNERHCGDLLARKTWTPNYLDHKSKKNNRDRNQYRVQDHHEAIISRDDFLAVQKILRNTRKSHEGFLPRLKIINEGILNGFISVHPTWKAFSSSDYYAALELVRDKNTELKQEDILPGFSIVSNSLFNDGQQLTLTIREHSLQLSTYALRILNSEYGDLYINPRTNSIAIVRSNSHLSIKWGIKSSELNPRTVNATAFIHIFREVLKINTDISQKFVGQYVSNAHDAALVFYNPSYPHSPTSHKLSLKSIHYQPDKEACLVSNPVDVTSSINNLFQELTS